MNLRLKKKNLRRLLRLMLKMQERYLLHLHRHLRRQGMDYL
jgi:hypothetical protein